MGERYFVCFSVHLKEMGFCSGNSGSLWYLPHRSVFKFMATYKHFVQVNLMRNLCIAAVASCWVYLFPVFRDDLHFVTLMK